MTRYTAHGVILQRTMADRSENRQLSDYGHSGILREDACILWGGSPCPHLYSCRGWIELRRALEREQQQTVPKYKEMCRRFLADEEDFSPSHLEQSNITRQYENVVLEDCLREIVQEIERICHTQ